MNDNYYIKKIEELNLEIINLKNSKEYMSGQKYINITKCLKSKNPVVVVNELIKKYLNKKKAKQILRYNEYDEPNNDFMCDDIVKQKTKIVVYTCITGKYDKLIKPFLKLDNVDYVAFSDVESDESNMWNVRKIPENVVKLEDNILINRYIKFHPAELLGDTYNYAIYVDGNISIISDLTELINAINPKTGLAIHRHRQRNCSYKEVEVCKIVKKGNYDKMKEQLQRYKEEGFPENFGLYEASVIASDLKNEKATNILDLWWNEFKCSESYRDQISLPYIVWKNKYDFNDIGSLGNNVYKNPKFRIEKHKK